MIRTAIITLAALSVAAPAFADRYEITVSYADLDISKPAGRATLDRRVAAAINEVCASETSGTTAFQEERQCKRVNLERVHQKLAMNSSDRVLALR